MEVDNEVEISTEINFVLEGDIFFNSQLLLIETWKSFVNGKITFKDHPLKTEINFFIAKFIDKIKNAANYKTSFSRFLKTKLGYTLILKCSTTCDVQWHVRVDIQKKNFVLKNEKFCPHEIKKINTLMSFDLSKSLDKNNWNSIKFGSNIVLSRIEDSLKIEFKFINSSLKSFLMVNKITSYHGRINKHPNGYMFSRRCKCGRTIKLNVGFDGLGQIEIEKCCSSQTCEKKTIEKKQ